MGNKQQFRAKEIGLLTGFSRLDLVLSEIEMHVEFRELVCLKEPVYVEKTETSGSVFLPDEWSSLYLVCKEPARDCCT